MKSDPSLMSNVNTKGKRMCARSDSSKNLTPLLVTSMAVLVPLIFVLGLVVGNNLKGTGSLAADSVSSWLSAIATVAIAVLTFILAKETWYLREAQIQQLVELKRENIRPNVGVQLESSRVGVNFVNVKVSNLGKGIARNIQFKFLDRAGNPVSEGEDVVAEKFRKLAMFRGGLQSLGIGEAISSFVFSFIDLGTELGSDVFKPFLHILVTFEDVEGYQYSNSFAVDFAQYEGISELGTDSLYEIACEVKKLREHLGYVVNRGKGRVEVDVHSSVDRHDEVERDRARTEERRKAASA